MMGRNLEKHHRYETRPYKKFQGHMGESIPFMSSRERPTPDPDWQLRAVVECLAGPLDDDWMSTHSALIARLTASDPQFQYNPRTKAGKALRDAMVAEQEEI